MKLYLYGVEKRSIIDRRTDGARTPNRRGNERRKHRGCHASYIDTLIDQLRHDLTKSLEFFKDKERKKLVIVTSAFGAIAIILSLLMGQTFDKSSINISGNAQQTAIVDSDATVDVIRKEQLEISKQKEIKEGFIKLFVLSIIALFGLVLIKYIVSLKGEGLKAIRQVNCVRQGIHALLYLKLQS